MTDRATIKAVMGLPLTATQKLLLIALRLHDGEPVTLRELCGAIGKSYPQDRRIVQRLMPYLCERGFAVASKDGLRSNYAARPSE